MKLLIRLKHLDQMSKTAFVLFMCLVSYIILMFILKPVFIPQDVLQAHTTVMGDHIMTFTNPNESRLNISAIALSIGVGFALSLLLHKKDDKSESAENAEKKETRIEKKREIDILKKALNADQKKIIEEIEKEREITQDSLRFRLEWSKAKISTILTRLDKMGLIQRRRE
ncbi:hypothetical protein COV16_03165, partial [Candidatus Woesearchaeota archaeon CG10_big_fil_rev_8_21_14_0_10_34_8]